MSSPSDPASSKLHDRPRWLPGPHASTDLSEHDP
jgi:hypothetical protein